jgi:hypothetical protein
VFSSSRCVSVRFVCTPYECEVDPQPITRAFWFLFFFLFLSREKIQDAYLHTFDTDGHLIKTSKLPVRCNGYQKKF